jgi:hypothetical protein
MCVYRSWLSHELSFLSQSFPNHVLQSWIIRSADT